MRKMTLGEVVRAVNAECSGGTPDLSFTQVSTDTRKLKKGSLFFALVGERFDAHDFIEEALKQGASGLVVSKPITVSKDIPVLKVEDTLTALQKLASYNRSKFTGPVIAITGSNGKTSTKDMVSSVLEQKFKVLKTFGNLNNEIGLPLTLLKLDESYEAVILEMGMRGLGEIDLLAQIAGPTAGIITNVGETHLERLGNIENIARAKTELLPYIPKRGYAVLNGEDQWLRKYAHRVQSRVIFFGMENGYQIYAKDIKVKPGIGSEFTVVYNKESQRFYVPVPGKHNIYNAVAAICIGLEEGLTWEECQRGIEEVILTGMRLQVINKNGLKIINDTYNANPASTKAALDILAEMSGKGRKVAVLGDMYELGERACQGHKEVGEFAVSLGIDIIVTVGNLAEDICKVAANMGMSENKVFSCENNQEAMIILKGLLQPGDKILVKGSRGMKMEEIVKGLSG